MQRPNGSRQNGLLLPLKRAGSINGPAHYLATRDGVVVGTRDTITLRSHDLNAVKWCTTVPKFLGVGRVGNRILSGPFEGAFWQLSLRSGEIENRIKYEGLASVAVARDDLIVLVNPIDRMFEAIDWSGRPLWSLPSGHGIAVVCSRFVLLTDVINKTLRCVDPLSGEVRWIFATSKSGSGGSTDRSNEIVSARLISEERLLLTVLDCRVFCLSLETGDVLGEGKPPVVGRHAVEEDRIYFQNPFSLSEFDVNHMAETQRWDYRDIVEPLYKTNRPTSNGFLLTRDSLIWTTAHGTIMGLSRVFEIDRAVTWYDEINTMMPLGAVPSVYGGFMYFSTIGSPSQLLCWQSVAQVLERGARC